jgi:SCY1-like protein 1
MWGWLKTAGVGGSAFPYEVGEMHTHQPGWSIFVLHKGKRRSDGAPVNVFVFDGSKRNPQDITIAKNALKRMKTLRHPNFLKFLDR